MSFEEVPNWIWQNGIPLAVGLIIGAIVEILFKELFFNAFVAPSFRHKLSIIKKKADKWFHNTTIELSYSSRTRGLEERRIEKAQISKIMNYLREQKIAVTDKSDLVIDNYMFGDLKFTGIIEFGTISTSKGEFLQDLDITLNTRVRYKSINDDITAILQGIDKLKQYVALALDIPLEYHDSMSCRLPNMIIELAETMKDLNIEYIKFGGKADVSVYKDKVVFNPPLNTSAILPTLRKLVVLYA
jgi:hypothetical protein